MSQRSQTHDSYHAFFEAPIAVRTKAQGADRED